LYWDPAHHEEAREALVKAGRGDLIGTKPHCLVPPAAGKGALPRYMQRQGNARGGKPAGHGPKRREGGAGERGPQASTGTPRDTTRGRL
jgi:hypothetical protein